MFLKNIKAGSWSPLVIVILAFPFIAFFARALADTLIVIIGAAFLYRSQKNHDWSWVRKPWFALALILWAYLVLIVSPQAEDTLHSLISSLIFMRWPLFAAALAYWILADAPLRRKFEWSVAALAIFVMADSVYQYFSGHDIFGYPSLYIRLTGPFDKPVPGTFTLRVFFIALAAVYFGIRFKSVHLKLLTILGLLAMGAGFGFITGERVAFAIFLFGSLIVFLGLWLSHPGQRHFLLGIGIALGVLIGFAASTQAKMVDRSIHSLVDGLSDYTNQPGGRIILSAINIWSDHPILGVGIDNFDETCKEYLARGQAVECNMHPHNVYIQWLVESGIIGLGLFVALVSSLFVTVWRNRPCNASPMLPLLASVVLLTSLWPFMGSMSFFSNWIAAVVWMGIGWALAGKDEIAAKHPSEQSS